MTREQIRQCADIIRETVSALDYATLIGIHVGRNGFAQCPFHSGDHTGSLKVYSGRRGWHCFGCGASGDVIELAKRFYNLSFPQAIAKVAADAGIPLPGVKPTYRQAQAISAAQKRKEEREHQEQITQAYEAEFWATLDDWLEIDRLFTELEQRIRAILKEGNQPNDDLMDAFFGTYAAKLNIEPELERLEIGRIKQ